MTDFSKMSDEQLRIEVAKALGWTDADLRREKQWNHSLNLLLNEDRPKMRESWAEAARSIRDEAEAAGGKLVVPKYSTSIADAWDLIHDGHPMNWFDSFKLYRYGDGYALCKIGTDEGTPFVEAPTAPRAICLAFLATRTK